MRCLIALLLLLCVAIPMDSTAQNTRKNRRNKTTVTPPTPAPAPVAKPTPQPTAEPVAPKPAPKITVKTHRSRHNDLNLGMCAEQMDSLLAIWRERQSADAFDEFFRNYILVDSVEQSTTPDSLFKLRLIALASPIQLPYNSIVRNYINRYVDSRYGTISRVLGLSQYYFPLIEDELIKEGLPIELRAMPIIESALTATATSRMGAVGLWQFMPATGKSYGLEINSLIDERRDPVRATQAACRYMKDMYAIYGDWSLSIAAYNCGPGNVNKALARSGGNNGKKTFWDVYEYLPRETRGYVPAFIAASYAYAYHRQHGITVSSAPIPLSVDTIRVNRLMHLEQISSTIDIPLETLRQLNPQYKLDIIPATTKPYTLILPQRNIGQYIANEAQIIAKDSLYLKEYLNPKNIEQKRLEGASSTTNYYTVKRGDTLGSIARRYRTTTTQLMRTNGIKNAKALRIGQRLRVNK